jgi:hypothetical protein
MKRILLYCSGLLALLTQTSCGFGDGPRSDEFKSQWASDTKAPTSAAQACS